MVDEISPHARRLPLRFMWQMDAEGRFSLGSDEFTRLIGARTASSFGRLWSDIAASLRARSRWPRRQGGRHARYLERHHVELAGRWRRPVAGRIVGIADVRSRAEICRLSRLRGLPRPRRPGAARGLAPPRVLQRSAARRPPMSFRQARPDAVGTCAQTCRPQICLLGLPPDPPEHALNRPHRLRSSAPSAVETSHQTDLETPWKPQGNDQETPEEMLRNVLPFRPIGEPKSPVLTPVENSAFNELARQLSARLDSENGAPATPAASETPAAVVDPPAANRKPSEPRHRSNRHGWRARSRRRAAKPSATRRCSICCPSAS